MTQQDRAKEQCRQDLCMALRQLNDASRNLADAANTGSDAKVIRAAQIWDDAQKQASEAKADYMKHLTSRFDQLLTDA